MRGNNESIGEIPAKYVQWKTKIDCKRDEKRGSFGKCTKPLMKHAFLPRDIHVKIRGGGAVEGNIVTVETTSSSNVLRNCDLDVVVFAGFIVAAVYCSTGIDSISGPPPTTKARNRWQGVDNPRTGGNGKRRWIRAAAIELVECR